MKTGTITFPNSSCVALWNNELTGQMSDGMWENSGPRDHWKFWGDLDAQVGADCKVVSPRLWECRKTGYNFAALYEIVGERMVATGRMGKHTTDYNACHAAEYMPATLEEFRSNKASGKWQYDFVAKYMESVSDDLAQKFYATTYTMRDLRKDISSIKAAMKTAKN